MFSLQILYIVNALEYLQMDKFHWKVEEVRKDDVDVNAWCSGHFEGVWESLYNGRHHESQAGWVTGATEA